MRKPIEAVMRAVDHYAEMKDKRSREQVRAWCRLLYREGYVDGRLEHLSPAKMAGKNRRRK